MELINWHSGRPSTDRKCVNQSNHFVFMLNQHSMMGYVGHRTRCRVAPPMLRRARCIRYNKTGRVAFTLQKNTLSSTARAHQFQFRHRLVRRWLNIHHSVSICSLSVGKEQKLFCSQVSIEVGGVEQAATWHEPEPDRHQPSSNKTVTTRSQCRLVCHAARSCHDLLRGQPSR